MPKKTPQKNAYYEFQARQKAEKEAQKTKLAKIEASIVPRQKKKTLKLPAFPRSVMLALRSQRAKANQEIRTFSDLNNYDSVKVRDAQKMVDAINLALSKGKHNDGSMRAIRRHRDWLATQPISTQNKYGYSGLNRVSEGPLDYSTRRPGNGKLSMRNSHH